MTQIYVGNRELCLARIRRLDDYPVRVIYSELAETKPAATVNRDQYLLWAERNREHLVWVNPPKDWNPKDLTPHPGRHLIFCESEDSRGRKQAPNFPALWKKWATAHKLEPETLELPTDAQREAFLVSGRAGIKFTRDAAKMLCIDFPGGIDALFWPVEALKLMEAKQPISADDAALVCFNGENLKLANQICKNLGNATALQLAATVDKKNAFGGLKYFEAACKKAPVRLEYLEALFQGIDARRWHPWIALQLFVHLCYQEKNQESACQSPSKMAGSCSVTMPGFYRLLGIPSSHRTSSAVS